jgi:FkbM family methyltransferase
MAGTTPAAYIQIQVGHGEVMNQALGAGFMGWRWNVLLHAARVVRRAARRFGVDVSFAEPNIIDFIKDRQITLVYDIGANTGQFASKLRRGGYEGTIVSFEPIRSVFEILASNAKFDCKWAVHNCGLGAAQEELEINISRETKYSSILDMEDLAAKFDPMASVERVEKISIKTLDEISVGENENIFIKSDTQGYERQVMEGGKITLRRSAGILMELPIMQLYKGNWEFYEAIAHMASVGFVPAQIVPVSYDVHDKVSLLEVDCLFRPVSRKDAK